MQTKWGYCDQLIDFESGNYYMRARYYNPEIGRFINEDPIRDGLNWYSYCNSNPVMFCDIIGLESSYIFYNMGDSKNDSLRDRAIKKEKEYKSQGKTVKIIGINSVEEFVKAWKSMNNNGNSIENVNLYFHSSPRGLIINYDTKEFLYGIDNDGSYSIENLPIKDIERINLYACNSAHQDSA